jgi:hypothetical protein
LTFTVTVITKIKLHIIVRVEKNNKKDTQQQKKKKQQTNKQKQTTHTKG